MCACTHTHTHTHLLVEVLLAEGHCLKKELLYRIISLGGGGVWGGGRSAVSFLLVPTAEFQFLGD